MNSMTNEQNSFNCSEESCNNPFADSIITSESIYNLCSEEAINMSRRRTEIIQKKKSESKLGIKNPMYGKYPWNKGKKGVQVAWNKGKQMSEECCLKNREAHLGRTPWNKGRKHPSLIGNTHAKGHIPWNKGKSLTEEHKKKLSLNHADVKGPNSPSWRGGLSFLPYCPKFNNDLKEQIRERDNRTCQLCGAIENGRKLSVHHIHYDKPNCDPDLIALCISCNTKVNSNQEYWEVLFMNKLKDRRVVL